MAYHLHKWDFQAQMPVVELSGLYVGDAKERDLEKGCKVLADLADLAADLAKKKRICTYISSF